MLIKRTERQARRGTLAGALPSQIDGGLDRRTFLRRSGLAAGGLATLGALHARLGAQGRGRTAAARRRAGHRPQEHLHPLLRRLHGDRGSRQRRLDRPGAELGQPDQSRLALRQGRLGARTGERRAPAEISDEARRTANGPAISWDQAIDEIGDKLMEIREQVGAGFGLSGSAPPR